MNGLKTKDLSTSSLFYSLYSLKLSHFIKFCDYSHSSFPNVRDIPNHSKYKEIKNVKRTNGSLEGHFFMNDKEMFHVKR